MIESFVDLTYRGLSLGRRVKLTQVRPSSGFLELASPMPVGAHVAIAAEDGVTFDATVSWVHEQVAGSDRTPGMVVIPAIVADPAASWWQARVTLPDEDKPALRMPRNRPATLRPRSFTEPAPPPDAAVAEEIPTAASDLTIRVDMAPGGEPVLPGGAPEERSTTAMNPLEQETLEQLSRSPAGESAARLGEHAVVDDGRKTVLVAPIADRAGGAPEESGASEESGAVEAAGAAEEAGDGGEASDGGETIDDSTTLDDSAPKATGGGDKPPPGRGSRKRRKRR